MNSDLYANLSGEWLEQMQELWRKDPSEVPVEWHGFFSGFELAGEGQTTVHDSSLALKQSGVQSLLHRYRSIGHLLACTDPLSECRLSHSQLELSCFGLDEHDLDTVFTCRRFMKQQASLREILTTMRETYCREIGVEFMHIQNPEIRQWLIDRMEPARNNPDITVADSERIYEKLLQASLFEAFLHRRFVGQKRFSLEGAEVLIPLLDALLVASAADGIRDVEIGMAHRGRLNVLAHVLGKQYEAIFAEFADTAVFGFIGDGDVKYHKGYSRELEIDGRHVHVTLASNPSHLEAVNAVVEGKCRSRQDRAEADGAALVLPVLIHGDASFAGQGSIMETLNLSCLDGYSTGGTIHIVINNQIGFTTLPHDSRSSRYATDIVKMLECPVFHVQGEAPEAVVHAIRLALEFRQQFRSDVVVEVICYRRYGHNEGDEPAFTQPLMYQRIKDRPIVSSLYRDVLLARGGDQAVLDKYADCISACLDESMGKQPKQNDIGFQDEWHGIARDFSWDAVETAVSGETLLRLARRLAELPPGFEAHHKIQTLMQKRLEAVLLGRGIDWGNAEILAYATLLDEGVPVRLSGQDSCRGTFNHRHSVIHDVHDGRSCTPLTAIGAGAFQVWNSPLSEFAVLGFEYGYSLERPHGLTIWEAQFGDFANGAQVVIDQFLVSGETKWNRASGLTLFLPHGYEGQGAEHSSARIERFLQMCAGNNMVLACPSTPAQMFHLLRRQVIQTFRVPLIVFTPKSLLRHPACVSVSSELASGHFRELLVDSPDNNAVKKVLLCSGKLYYDLVEERERRQDKSTAIIRIEQLYPISEKMLSDAISGFSASCRVTWVQEEPENMGAWSHIRKVMENIGVSARYVGRPADSSPAVGSHKVHGEQQAALVADEFEG